MAGMEGSVTAGDDVKWHGLAGEERSGREWTGRHGNAGEVRQGSEAKGRDGRVEVRQEWSGEFVVARSGLARQERRGLERNEG